MAIVFNIENSKIFITIVWTSINGSILHIKIDRRVREGIGNVARVLLQLMDVRVHLVK